MGKRLSAHNMAALFLLFSLLACKKEMPQPYSGSGSSAGSGSGGNGGTNNSRVTYPPVAYAGADTTIYTPFSGYFLNGAGTKDQDNNIASFTWRLIAGPSLVTIFESNARETNATGLSTQGVYSFELTVQDYDNLSARDTVFVTVGNTNCSGQLSEIILTNLQWEFSWSMDLNIEIAKVLPPHSRVKGISIKRDNNISWEPVVILNTNSPDYKYHTWAYGTNILQIYPPDDNVLHDTPDVKIQYCN